MKAALICPVKGLNLHWVKLKLTISQIVISQRTQSYYFQ